MYSRGVKEEEKINTKIQKNRSKNFKILTANMGSRPSWSKTDFLKNFLPFPSGHQLNFLIAKAGKVSQLSYLAKLL